MRSTLKSLGSSFHEQRSSQLRFLRNTHKESQLSSSLNFTQGPGSPQQHDANYCGRITVPPPHERQTTTPGTTSPKLYEQCVGSLTSHRTYICKGCDMGPTVYRPYPRRLESLTVCRCLYKGSAVRPGLEPAASLSADRSLSN